LHCLGNLKHHPCFCRIKEVRANCFCASLLRTKFTRHVIHQARTLSSKVNNNRENGHCYNFVWISQSSTYGDPYFSFNGSFSLPISYVLRKNEENVWSRSFNFLQSAPSNSVYLTSSFSCAAVSNASLSSRFVKMMAILEIINATDSLIQNIIRIACLC